jgi:diadenosine tetraphosphate (Ap4A) HIT family hydrolase
VTECSFCRRLQEGSVTARTEYAAAFLDAFPVAEGHTLIVPLTHESDFFALGPFEQAALWELAGHVRAELAASLEVEAFNIGLNYGKSAGQTVDHAHIHVIPRRPGDVADPRGGIRWVIPDRAPYWS